MARASEGRRRSIRFRLGVALALALLPVLLLGAFETWRSFQDYADRRGRAVRNAAARAAVSARGEIRSAEALLRALGARATGPHCGENLATTLQLLADYENLVRLDAQGRVICAAAPLAPDPARARQAWFRQMATGRELVIADAPAGRYGRAPALLAAVPAADGSGQGAIVAAIRLDRLQPDVKDTSLPPGTETALVGADGRLVGASRAAAFAPLPRDWATQASGQRSWTMTGVDPQGQRRLQALAPMADGRIYAAISAPDLGLISFARLNPFTTLLLPLLAWLLAWGAASLVIDRLVVRWLAYLERVAALYGRGRFSVRPSKAESAPTEIRALADTLNDMAEGLVSRDASLRESLVQKDAMMREIHHRVKNNLQVITSLLNMQQRTLADGAARDAISDTRQRISALALIYRALYQSPDLKRVDVRQFLEELTAQLSAGEGGISSKIRTDLEADDLEIDPDKLAPLALFAVEAITNARKHAFGENGGVIHVRLRVDDGVLLEIADDGEGGGAAITAVGGGVGSTLMSAFARQLRGTHTVAAGPERGVLVRLSFPRPDAPEPPQPEQRAAA